MNRMPQKKEEEEEQGGSAAREIASRAEASEVMQE